VERFGASAPGQEVLDRLGFTAEHVASAALRILGRKEQADQLYRAEATLVPA
jgi:transketolase